MELTEQWSKRTYTDTITTCTIGEFEVGSKGACDMHEWNDAARGILE